MTANNKDFRVKNGIVAGGNVSAVAFIGDGSQLTGISSSANIPDHSITLQKLAPANFTYSTYVGDGSTLDYTLAQTTQTPEQLFVFVANVPQTPGTSYTVNGTTLSFSSAPSNGSKIVVRYYGTPLPFPIYSDKLVNNSHEFILGADGVTTVPGNVIPPTSGTYTLGDVNHRWADVWIGPNTLNIQDQHSGANAALTVYDGALRIDGASLIQLGGMKLLSSGLTFPDNSIQTTAAVAQVNSDWNAISGKAQILNKPTLFSGSYNDLTNKPTIPSLTGYATETYVNTQVSNLVNAAPSTLDTLNELATALGNDANFATTISTQLGLKANTASLGSAAFTSSSTYATAAQGGKADTAIQSITSSDASINVINTGTSVDLTVSADSPASTLVAQVRNETGATLTKGTIVYSSGAAGNKMLVVKALASGESTSSQTFGMITADIPNNQNGYATISGVVSGLNTSGLIEGGIIYLSPTVEGQYTQTKPQAPNHLVYVGIVTRVHANQGSIQTRIQNGYELDELHDVLISSKANNDLLRYDIATGVWKNAQLSSAQVTTALGYTPYNSTNPNGYITGINSSNVTTALGYTPYNATNPNGYISSITSSNVTTALGYTPYNATNPSGYLTASTEVPANVSDKANTSTGYFSLPKGTTAQRPSSPFGGMWRFNSTTNFNEYWDPITSNWIPIGGLLATGGTIVDNGGYRYHTFTSSGTFQVLSGSKNNAIVLNIAGGGSGGGAGNVDGAGGGGAGGLVYASGVNLSPGAFTVIVGAGGASQTSAGQNGYAGSDSSINLATVATAIGGGYASAESASRNAGSGGSGGGGGGYQSTNLGGSGTSGQGNAGAPAQTVNGGGGGGGAGSAASAKNGGNGLQYSTIATATSTGANSGYYAAGGGGSGDTRGTTSGGTGGLGGGGNGAAASSGGTPVNGTINTGSGGGGSAGTTPVGSVKPSGSGGSGIVIIAYPYP